MLEKVMKIIEEKFGKTKQLKITESENNELHTNQNNQRESVQLPSGE